MGSPIPQATPGTTRPAWLLLVCSLFRLVSHSFMLAVNRVFLCHASYEYEGNNSDPRNRAMAGSSRLAKQSLGTKASTTFKASPGTSTAPESMIIGASGL